MDFVFLWFRSSVPGTTICTELSLSSISLNYGFCSYLRKGLGWHFPKVVGFELFTSLVMAFISWQLFSACQRPSSWGNPVSSPTADIWLKKSTWSILKEFYYHNTANYCPGKLCCFKIAVSSIEGVWLAAKPPFQPNFKKKKNHFKWIYFCVFRSFWCADVKNNF